MAIYQMLNITSIINRYLVEINRLNIEDKELITNLLIQEKTERELAKQLNVSQNAIHKRKNNILKKVLYEIRAD